MGKITRIAQMSLFGNVLMLLAVATRLQAAPEAKKVTKKAPAAKVTNAKTRQATTAAPTTGLTKAQQAMAEKCKKALEKARPDTWGKGDTSSYYSAEAITALNIPTETKITIKKGVGFCGTPRALIDNCKSEENGVKEFTTLGYITSEETGLPKNTKVLGCSSYSSKPSGRSLMGTQANPHRGQDDSPGRSTRGVMANPRSGAKGYLP